jgi:predicted  nucleic acid-binding Zn-ribbon protein
MNSNSQNGWNEWSKHVLKELERLNSNDEHIKEALIDIKKELFKVSTFEKDIEEIKEWKEKMDDIASISQLKDMKKEIDNLKTFKIVSTTIFFIGEFLLGLLIAFKDKLF